MIKKKINWIYNLKALGILAVILGHMNSPFGAFIYSWHMPLFFILSGFFIKFDLSIKEFFIKNFKRLLIPYFIFVFIGLGVEILKRIILQRDSLIYVHELKGIFIWMDMQSLINTYAFVLWFLPALFFARFFLMLINKYVKNLLLQLLIVSMLFSFSFFLDLPFAIDNAFNAILFLFIGNVYIRFYQENKFLYILPFVVLAIYIAFGVPSLDIASKNYSNIFLNIIFSIGITYTIILFFKKMNYTNKLLKNWGGNTMLLFIMHPYTNNIAYIIVKKISFKDWYLEFLVSLVLLQMLLFIKQKFENRGIFKYV